MLGSALTADWRPAIRRVGKHHKGRGSGQRERERERDGEMERESVCENVRA